MSESTLTKKQKLLAGVVCSSIALELVNVLTQVGNAFAYNPRHADWLSVLGSLLAIPVLLKFLLPDWQPHKKWLGRLLGLAFTASLLFEVYSLISLWGGKPVTFDANRIYSFVLDIISVLANILLNPLLPLLIGIARKKSTEKTAGVFAAISFGGLAVLLIFTYTDVAMVVGVPPIYLMKLYIYLAYSILFFTWPVLTRPILEIEQPRSEEATEDIIA